MAERIIDKRYYDAIAEQKISSFLRMLARQLFRPYIFGTKGKSEFSIHPEAEIAQKPFVLAGAHRDKIDIPIAERISRLLGATDLRFMYKEEYFEAGLDPLFRRLGGYAVNRRNANFRGITRVQAEFVKQGQSLGIFPEGTRVTAAKGYDTRTIQELGEGAAYAALTFGLPLIPYASAGLADNDSGRGLYHVVGAPIEPIADTGMRRSQATKAMTIELQTSLQACIDQAYALRDAA
jgi:1-acyl-sn-glycerol-3-phosphate acyltransferase